MDETRLSQIATQWSLIFEGARGPDAVKAAQANLLERYCGAVYRYACRVLGDSDMAEEACQEFAYRFVRGDFRHADPTRGRFRDYVKTSVIHLLNEFRRRQINKRALPLDSQAAGVVSEPSVTSDEDAEFTAYWRKELLNRAWRELELREPADGPPSYTILRLKADEPNLTAAVLAERLGQFGRSGYIGSRRPPVTPSRPGRALPHSSWTRWRDRSFPMTRTNWHRSWPTSSCSLIAGMRCRSAGLDGGRGLGQ